MKEKRGAAMGITVLAVVLAFLVVAGVLYYNKVYKPSVQQAVQETTSYKAGGTEPQKAETNSCGKKLNRFRLR